jgi:SAM-dependent methyltransferase
MDLRSLLTRSPAQETDGVLDYIADGAADYCANFGDQWNRFRSIQIDSLSGKDESHRRFFAETDWRPDDLKGKVILDAGCGAGRFAEVALECGAYLVAADLSEAVYACRRTVERFPQDRYLVIRADLFDLPLQAGRFDGVYSLGVLQHTPDPLEAVRRLAKHLAPGGRLATWIYEVKKSHLRALQPRLWIRAMTARWSTRAKLRLARILTALFFPFGWLFSWLGRPGQLVSYFLPYACRHHLGRGSWRRQWDYCVMDTFDWYGPRYELSQTEGDVKKAYRSAGLTDIRRTGARGMAIVGQAPRFQPGALTDRPGNMADASYG